MEPEFQEARVLRLQAGDAIVLKIRHKLSAQQIDELKQRWLKAMAGSGVENTKFVVLDEGAALEVLRHEDAELTAIARSAFKKAQG